MNAEALYKEANELDNAGHHSQAAKIYEQLVELFVDARFHIAYGYCLQQTNHWKESTWQFQKGISLKPHYCEGDARLMLANSYMKLRRQKNAVEQWKIVAAMNPEYPSYEAVPNEAKEFLKKYDR
jgi:tetratricopeptide (TPR) repeat protein